MSTDIEPGIEPEFTPNRVETLEAENADLKERLGRVEMDSREADLKRRESVSESTAEILARRNRGEIPDEIAGVVWHPRGVSDSSMRLAVLERLPSPI